MNTIVNRLKFNKFSLFITLLIAFSAAFFTLIFVLFEGIRSISTMIFRVFISFTIFAVIGYVLSVFIEKEYLSSLVLDDNEKIEVEEENIKNQQTQITDDNLKENKPEKNNSDDKKQDLPNDDSFDRIVIVNNDIDG